MSSNISRTKIAEIAINAQKQFDSAMRNVVKTDPWVPMKFGGDSDGGKEYRLEYSYKAAKQLVRDLGLNPNVGALTMQVLSNLDILPTAIRAGLLTHHADEFSDDAAGVDKVESMMRTRFVTYYAWCVQKGVEATQPDYEQIKSMIPEMDEALSKTAESEETPSPLAPTLN